MNTNSRLALALAIGVGLAGCTTDERIGPGTAALPDSGISSFDGASSLPDGVASLPDRAATGPEVAAPAEVRNASEAGPSADRPTSGVEAGREAAALPADASVDLAAAPSDVAFPTDSLLVTPDAATAEAVVRMDATEAPSRPDAPGTEAAKPADAIVVDRAAGDVAPAKLAELSPQELHDALATKDFLLIDVHYPNAGSIPGTDARIAFDDIPALVAFIGPDLNRKVVLTCLMGGMSKSAGNALVALGYRNVSELTGGMNAWTAAGYQLVHLDGGL